MNTMSDIKKISHLEKREIQAPLVAALLRGFAREYGEEALESAEKTIQKDAAQAGKDLADEYGGNSFEKLLEIAKEVWAADGTMELKNIQLEKDTLSFEVTRCGYADLYAELGIKDLGTLLSCCRDYAFLDGFNPDIELVRTKTIMEGDDACNFCYRMKTKSGEL